MLQAETCDQEHRTLSYPIKKGREADERGDFLAKEITTEEIRSAVKQAKRGKVVGEDGIPNEFMKEGGEVVVGKTEYLFNVVKEEEYVPKVWRVGDSVLLEKRGDNEDLNNYRGITLQSCVGKIYGKILGSRLWGDAEKSGGTQ